MRTLIRINAGMDTIRSRWAEDPSRPLLVHAPRRSGKTGLVCALAAEHLEAGDRVCVVVTCKRLVQTLTRRIAELCRQNGLAIAAETPDRIAYGDGWVRCTVKDIDDGASVILVDEAPCVDPEWFYDTLVPRMEGTPALLVGTHTSDVNYFARLCRAPEPGFNAMEAF